MDAQRLHMETAFELRPAAGGALIFPPGEVEVRHSGDSILVSVGNHDPVRVHPHEIERLRSADQG